MIWPPLLPVAQYSPTPWFQVRSRSHLVSKGVYPFVLPLPLAQKEYWDTTRSHANAQNQGVGGRGRGKGMYWDWPLVQRAKHFPVALLYTDLDPLAVSHFSISLVEIKFGVCDAPVFPTDSKAICRGGVK